MNDADERERIANRLLLGGVALGLGPVGLVIPAVWGAWRATRWLAGKARDAHARGKAARSAREADRHSRERDAAERQFQLEKEKRVKDEKSRKDQVRYDAELLYRRHYDRVKESLPREAFDLLAEKFFGKDVCADELERRLKDLRAYLLELAAGTTKEAKQRTPEDVTRWYETELRRLASLPMEEKDKATNRSLLLKKYVELMNQIYQEIQP